MSIGDALNFERSWLGDIWKGVRKDPKRLILGVDPLSTKAWNAVLGRHDKSIVGDFGGPTKESYDNAQAKGINTGTASTLHGIAKGVAGIWGGYGAAGGIGNAASSIGAGSGGLDAVGSGAYANGAVADAGLSTGSATPAAAPAASSGFDWQSLARQGGMPQQGQQQGQDPRQAMLEQWIEQERLRREQFRRDQIARAMGS